MQIKTDVAIKKYMLNNAYKHVNSANCLCMTTLAEETAEHFKENNGNSIPDRYFELAHEVCRILQRKTLVNY